MPEFMSMPLLTKVHSQWPLNLPPPPALLHAAEVNDLMTVAGAQLVHGRVKPLVPTNWAAEFHERVDLPIN